jgi:hypothetical protein
MANRYESKMNFLSPDTHAAVFCPETGRLGEILWYLLKAEQMMREKCQRRIKEGPFDRIEPTEFGDEVGRDEIGTKRSAPPGMRSAAVWRAPSVTSYNSG